MSAKFANRKKSLDLQVSILSDKWRMGEWGVGVSEFALVSDFFAAFPITDLGAAAK